MTQHPISSTRLHREGNIAALPEDYDCNARYHLDIFARIRKDPKVSALIQENLYTQYKDSVAELWNTAWALGNLALNLEAELEAELTLNDRLIEKDFTQPVGRVSIFCVQCNQLLDVSVAPNLQKDWNLWVDPKGACPVCDPEVGAILADTD